MSGFSEKTFAKASILSTFKKAKSKSLMTWLVILAMMITMMPVTAYAGLSYDYIISNDGENFKVVNGLNDELIATCSTFSEALASCTTADLRIFLGSDGNPLELDSSNLSGLSNALISGTYYGSAAFTVVDGGDGGFVIPDGKSVTFYGVTVTNTSADTVNSFTPIVVNSGGVLNIGSHSTLTAAFESTTNNCIVRNNGVLNITSGTVCGDNNTRIGIWNSATGTLNLSGGSISSAMDYDGIAVINYGNITVSDSVIISAPSCGIYAGGGAGTSIAVTGGTIEETYYGYGAIYLSSATQSTVTITGGTVKSLNNSTLKLAPGPSAGAKFTVYGLNIYRSSDAYITVTGVVDGSDTVITSANYGDATVDADISGDNLNFAAWTSDNEGANTISIISNDTIANFSASSNENVYLKTVFSDTSAPGAYGDTITRLSDSLGWLTFGSSEAGTYYYKVVENNAAEPVIDSDDPGTYDGSGQAAGHYKLTTISAITLSVGPKDIYIVVKDAEGNLGDAQKMDFLPFGLKGSGDWDDPLLIGTADELKMFGTGEYGLDRCYSLTADIDMTGITFTPVGAVAGGNTESTYSGEEFEGTFYGNNHTISNLAIEGTDYNFQGLFGWVSNSAAIKDLNLSDVDVNGSNSIGALAGVNQGNIDNCSVSGNVTATEQNAGGLVGQNKSGTIENCHSHASVTGGGIAGGLFGSVSGGTIDKCYADADVVLTDSVEGKAGIFAGTISGDTATPSIQNCYATGTVTGFEGAPNLGGFAGSISEGTINNCYVSASLQKFDSPSAQAFCTGPIATMTNCFYNFDAFPDQNTISGLAGMTTEQMTTQSSYTDWDFTTVWAIGSANDGYPVLKQGLPELTVTVSAGSVTSSTKAAVNWGGVTEYAILINDDSENGCAYVGDALPADTGSYVNGADITEGVGADKFLHVYALNGEGAVIADNTYEITPNRVNAFAGGTGSEADPFKITTAAQLAAIGEFTDWDSSYFFILENDIDLNVSLYNEGEGWMPIERFAGTFDGNGKTISNLMINRPDDSSVGLFSRVREATIKNLTVKDADVTGNEQTGILIGRADDIHVEKISVSGTVTGKSRIGGLAGNFGSSPKTIVNCFSTADVSGSGLVGGLVGYIESSAITNSYAAGTVSIVNPHSDIYSGKLSCEYIGGLVGADDLYQNGTNVFTSNYYDAAVSKQSDLIGATPKTTDQMKTQSTFTGWDFLTIWSISADVNGGYPYLQGFGIVSQPPAPSDTDSNGDFYTPPGASVIVDGVKQEVGTAKTSSENGQSKTEVIFDSAKLDKILGSAENGATVLLSVTGGSNIASGVLTGQMVKDMEKKDAILEVKTNTAAYTLPASQVNIDAVSSQLGASVTLSDIKVEISIAEPSDAAIRVVENAANDAGFTIMVPAVDFKISCTYGGQTVDVSSFNSYVERTVAIPDGVDPNKITTGVVVDPDGTIHHVPTRITVIDGKYYAVINSLTNSTYTVIWHSVEFADVADHWAKDFINDMGSRMIVTGVKSGAYQPDRDMTRAEFATIVVRALGLRQGVGDNKFTDVSASDWYCGYVETAVSYGIIYGYADGTFGPNEKITREQAMTMIARAMALTGLESSLPDSEINSLLSRFTDSVLASDYAKTGIAACLKNSIVTGKTGTTVAPKDYITRAEVAVIIERMLTKSQLI